ncbi:adenylate/guanylate cyclase domain-containing protein [Brevibacterium atlanticum]|uniref:adenylate/guanylate cyclase domain-containing protein n=1 Tax=Brevibacterium atlanticum TaxID=2697563 RepID=UPI001D18F4ED|nr:adenylate/guanylate cyclase domain-containing protein [Brevibacterium atlanticum]
MMPIDDAAGKDGTTVDDTAASAIAEVDDTDDVSPEASSAMAAQTAVPSAAQAYSTAQASSAAQARSAAPSHSAVFDASVPDEDAETADVSEDAEIIDADEDIDMLTPDDPASDSVTDDPASDTVADGTTSDGPAPDEPVSDGSGADTDTDDSFPDAEDFFGGLREDPRTSAIPIVNTDTDDAEAAEDDGPDFDDTIYETRTAAERLEEILLDGKRVLDRREAAKLGGISTVSARKMWRALGMSQAKETDKAYTVSDAHALRIWAKPVADGLIDQTTALSLARAIGQTTDRLVVWQMETLVEFLTEEKGLTDPEARRDALQVVEDMIDPLQKMLTYSWRRNLADVMGRLNVNVSDGLAMDNRQGWYDSSMPLARAVGFIDLVSFTRLSQQMEPRQLADMVQEFQGMAYNIVATGGGRVIKTVGDEVFFAASTPLAGAEIAMTLMERVTAAEDLPQARVGFVWGRVLSRLGDIFGSSVNLAARLTAVAEPGTIFTDEETARVLSASDDYVFEPRQSISLHGLGETSVGEMKRGTATRMRLDLDDDTEA